MPLEGLPWPIITAASGGWVLLGVALYGFITGKWWISTREANTYLQRAEKAEQNVENLVSTVAELTAVSKLQKATIEAALAAKRMQDAMQAEAGDVM